MRPLLCVLCVSAVHQTLLRSPRRTERSLALSREDSGLQAYSRERRGAPRPIRRHRLPGRPKRAPTPIGSQGS
jgi:hypothetical protein